jgi:endonuclease G
MRFRVLASFFAIACIGRVTAAQTIEERVSSLEAQVADLWKLHALNGARTTGVPADLVGNEHMQWSFPGGDCGVLMSEFFIICHDNANRIPAWVTYRLDAQIINGDAERTDDFRPDPRLPAGKRAELPDYEGSGYDRGHMAPAAAFKRGEEAMSETFLLSNMAPQTPALNRQIWRVLEEEVRQLASKASSIWVFTGSLFLDDLGSIIDPDTFIGENRVAVPTHFYKVMLADTAICAFLMPNQHGQLDGAPEDYLVTVDLVETLSGLDFFSALPDSLENLLEAELVSTWPIP